MLQLGSHATLALHTRHASLPLYNPPRPSLSRPPPSRFSHSTMAEHEGQRQQQLQQPRHPQEAVKGMLPDKGRGPSAQKVLAIVTLLPVGGGLLGLSGVALALTALGLAIATPVFLLFSPILVPAAIVIGLAVVGFLASGAIGLTGLTSLTWIVNYLRQARVPEKMERAKRRMEEAVGHRAREAGQTVQSKAQEAAGR